MTDYLRFILALGFVLGLVAVFALLLRRFGPGAGLVMRSRDRRRLAVEEVLALDARRRLVLVRRDGLAHLLLIGGENDLVVESGIPTGAAAKVAATEFSVALAAEQRSIDREAGPRSPGPMEKDGPA